MPVSSKRGQAYWLLAIGTVVIMGIVASNAILSGRPSRDNQTLCIGEPRSGTVIVLDRTDGLSLQTQNEVQARVEAFVSNSVAVGDLVSVFTIDDLSRQRLEPRFSYCKPPGSGNAAYENPRAIARQKRERFDEPLAKILKDPVGTTQESPIAEALIDLSQSVYLNRPEGANLLVFSDMLENAQAVSIYRCTSGEFAVSSFKAARAAALQRPRLVNVDVEIHVIPRAGVSAEAVGCRDYFWNWFFGNRAGKRSGFSAPNYLPGDVQ
jgi:hypothetical protein